MALGCKFDIPNYVWVGHRFYTVRCTYSWGLFHHALALDKLVVEFISAFNHTMHCADTTLDENWKSKGTSIIA